MALQQAQRRAAACPSRHCPTLRRVVVAQAASKPASKGFGARKEGPVKDGCPCGSNKFYKECCKPYHTGAAVPPDVESTIRARFSAVIKKEVPYLLSTFHPLFHSAHYPGTQPGAAGDKLREDMQQTVDNWSYSNLRIRKVEPGDTPEEAFATIQYTVLDKRTPELDAAGKAKRNVQVEQGQFLRGEDGVWRYADYKLVVVPEAVSRISDQQTKDRFEADLQQQFDSLGAGQQQQEQQQQQQQQQEQQQQQQTEQGQQ